MTSLAIRRIITAQRPTGESVVAVEEVIEPLVHPTNGMACRPISGHESVTRATDSGQWLAYVPCQLSFVHLGAQREGAPPLDEAVDEAPDAQVAR